jgi:hypothetical protein
VEPVKSGYALGEQVIELERTVTNKRSGKQSVGRRWFITSLRVEDVGWNRLATLIRMHWVVENNIHWLKDAVMKEDHTRQRNANAAQALGLLRTALLAPVRKAGHESLTRATEDFAANKWKPLKIIVHQRLA